MFSAAFDKPVYGEGKALPASMSALAPLCNIQPKPAGLMMFFRSF